MANITLSMTKDELTEAVREWVEKHGFAATDRFTLTFQTVPGDRPFDADYTTVTVSGIVGPGLKP